MYSLTGEVLQTSSSQQKTSKPWEKLRVSILLRNSYIEKVVVEGILWYLLAYLLQN